MWTLPDKGEGQNDLQSIMFQEYLDALVAGINGLECVLSGGVVTAQGSPNMTVAVANAAILTNGVLKAVAAGTGTITTADATNPRLDLVVIDSTGALVVRAGTAAAAPKPPARSANDVVLAVVYVPATDTTISSDQITDMRVLRTAGPITIAKTTTDQTIASSSTITTVFSFTLPSGLFLAGRILQIEMGGKMTLNSGTPTITLTINFGGTTMFADATATATASATVRAWHLRCQIAAQANNDQALAGRMAISLTGGATTGVGDMAVSTIFADGVFEGASAVDCDTGDRLVEFRITQSVNNAADSTTMEHASAVIL